MIVASANPPCPREVAELLPRLRAETADAHARLEGLLNLQERGADQLWFTRLLERFHGFHSVWEPLAAARLPQGLRFSERRRLTVLETDLQRLGRSRSEIARLPKCLAAARLAETAEAALGSLYVMEGSTLGGQVIAKLLAGLTWPPTGGLGYFQPYAARTGLMWRDLRAGLEQEALGLSHHAIVAGAQSAFAVLHDWLGPVAAESA